MTTATPDELRNAAKQALKAGDADAVAAALDDMIIAEDNAREQRLRESLEAEMAAEEEEARLAEKAAADLVERQAALARADAAAKKSAGAVEAALQKLAKAYQQCISNTQAADVARQRVENTQARAAGREAAQLSGAGGTRKFRLVLAIFNASPQLFKDLGLRLHTHARAKPFDAE